MSAKQVLVPLDTVIKLILKRASRFASMRDDAVHEEDWSRAATLEARVQVLRCLIEDVESIKPSNRQEAVEK